MAEKQLYTHNPNLFVLIIGGHIVQGFSEGSLVQVEMNADQVTLKTGVKGAAVRSISQDTSGRLTVSLMAGSPSNSFLSALADTDREDGTGTAPVQFTDLNGNMFVHAESAWVVKKPSADIQKEATERVWVLESNNIEYAAFGEA
jgi:hypothetical protein